jgi:hypothetical protein
MVHQFLWLLNQDMLQPRRIRLHSVTKITWRGRLDRVRSNPGEPDIGGVFSLHECRSPSLALILCSFAVFVTNGADGNMIGVRLLTFSLTLHFVTCYVAMVVSQFTLLSHILSIRSRIGCMLGDNSILAPDSV